MFCTDRTPLCHIIAFCVLTLLMAAFDAGATIAMASESLPSHASTLVSYENGLAPVTLPGPQPNEQRIGYLGGSQQENSPAWRIFGKRTLTAKKSILLEKGSVYLIDNKPSVWDGDKDNLVEFRMHCVERDKATGAHSAAELWLGGRRPKTGCQLFFREDAVSFTSSYSPCYRLDVTKTHTFKILTDIEAGKAYLFVDDGKTPVLESPLGSPEGLNTNRILFGDSSGNTATVHGQSEWEFVRWRFIPEPPLEIRQIDKRDESAADWTGEGPVRMIVKVPPRDLGKRKSDVMPARLEVDWLIYWPRPVSRESRPGSHSGYPH